MLREFLSGLKMNGPAMVLFLAQTKKAQERKLICKRKRDARRRFQAYVPPRGGGGTWVFFGWVCAARDSKLAPVLEKISPKIDTPF